jgi:hypothetical protein
MIIIYNYNYISIIFINIFNLFKDIINSYISNKFAWNALFRLKLSKRIYNFTLKIKFRDSYDEWIKG